MTRPPRRTRLPVGTPLPGWRARPLPPRTPMQGRFCRLGPLEADAHAADLFEAYREDAAGRGWTYMSYGPFKRAAQFEKWLRRDCLGDDPLFFAIIDGSGRAVGMTSFLR